MVGGTGLYLRALLQGLAPVPDIPAGVRDEAAALYRELGGAAFRDRLARARSGSGRRGCRPATGSG